MRFQFVDVASAIQIPLLYRRRSQLQQIRLQSQLQQIRLQSQPQQIRLRLQSQPQLVECLYVSSDHKLPIKLVFKKLILRQEVDEEQEET